MSRPEVKARPISKRKKKDDQPPHSQPPEVQPEKAREETHCREKKIIQMTAIAQKATNYHGGKIKDRSDFHSGSQQEK